jgi:O-acetyl-ADP-ribose deacetylase (regulator of RNase III)
VIRIVVDDLALVRVDAIVRPATTRLDPISPVHQHLEELGAPSFQQLRLSEELAVGSAVVTDGGNLQSGLVIHAIVKDSMGEITTSSVRRAMTSTLHRAAAWQITTVAIPPLGSATGGLSIESSADAMMQEIDLYDFAAGFPSELVIVVANPDDRRIFERLSRRTS